jgi:hypothetical protein
MTTKKIEKTSGFFRCTIPLKVSKPTTHAPEPAHSVGGSTSLSLPASGVGLLRNLMIHGGPDGEVLHPALQCL